MMCYRDVQYDMHVIARTESPHYTPQLGPLSWGSPRRNTTEARMKSPPSWLQIFLDCLAADDVSTATRRSYRYDLLQFISWYTGLNGGAPWLARLTEHDLITWRQHVVTLGGLKAASVNRRLEAAGPSRQISATCWMPRRPGRCPAASPTRRAPRPGGGRSRSRPLRRRSAADAPVARACGP